jgi:hypothetical protein
VLAIHPIPYLDVTKRRVRHRCHGNCSVIPAAVGWSRGAENACDDGARMRARAAYVVGLLLVVLVVLAVNSTAGRRWLEERADTIRWFTNEVKTLRP